MLASTAREPFDDPDKLFEVKWDGIRAIAVVENGSARLHTRGLKDISEAFDDVCAALLDAVKAGRAVLDGELIALDEGGVPRLQKVMLRWHPGRRTTKTVPVSFEVFDILHRDGQSLMALPLTKRKAVLNDTITPNDLVHVTHYEEGEGVTLYEAARGLGLEGIVGKDKASRYEPGRRSKHWVAIEHSRSANLVVGGYTFGGGGRKEMFGSLLLGAYDGNDLRYVGSVGGGFSPSDVEMVYGAITHLHRDTSPFADPPVVDKLLYWCEPALVVSVEYGEFTAQRQLRFPIFEAVRPDLGPRDCTIEAVRE